jgi:hypothetical protein
MAKFLWGVLVGAIVTVLGIFIIVAAIGRIFATKQPSIAANSVLVLALDGELPEAAPVDLSIPFFQKQSAPTVRDLWASLREAATDSRIKAIIIQPRTLLVGWGKLQELRQEIAEFKKSGKPVYAFLEGPGSREYYLTSIADKIFLSPDDMLDVKGFHVEEMYFKNTLDKLGIGVQVDHIGRYKIALLEHPGEIVTREALRQRMWPRDVGLNYDANVNTTVNKLRGILGDTDEEARFIETVPRKGYSFVAKVQYLEVPTASSTDQGQQAMEQKPFWRWLRLSGALGSDRAKVLFTAGVIALVIASILFGAVITLYSRHHRPF